MKDQIEFENGGVADWIVDLRLCLAFLSRLPVPVRDAHGRSLSSAMRAFPLAGALIGALGGMGCILALWLGVPAIVAGVISIAVLLLVTGGLHEDGLADMADGFGGGTTQERRLEIMEDSHIGSYGVLALACAILLKATALGVILAGEPSILATVGMFAALGAWSRTACVSLMTTTENSRDDGLASSAGRPSSSTHVTALSVGGVLTALCLLPGFGILATIAVFFLSVAAFLLVRSLAVRQIGGHTGDVAGAVQVVTETTMLVCLSAFAQAG